VTLGSVQGVEGFGGGGVGKHIFERNTNITEQGGGSWGEDWGKTWK